MSFGINDLQNAWSNFGNPFNDSGKNMGGSQITNNNTTVASGGNPLQPDQIKLPSWLSTNYDSQMGELLKTYSGIGAAFDPTAQVKARENAATYNLASGTSAANNAATEYANRAAQSGASSLGAGAVKAQAMMPVLGQNAALKTDAADIAAKSHEDAISLASQIAGTISQLRTSYLGTLTGYITQQQQLDLGNRQLQVQQAGQNQQANSSYWQYAQQLAQQQQAERDAQAASQYKWTPPTKPTSGSYTTDAMTGQVTAGQNTYDALKNWNAGLLL